MQGILRHAALAMICSQVMSCNGIEEKKERVLPPSVSVTATSTAGGPGKEFLELVRFIDSSGYRGDTTVFMKKIPYALADERQIVQGNVFYKLSLAGSPVHRNNDPARYAVGAEYCKVNEQLFGSCISIWAFAYWGKEGDPVKQDGFIEEFVFPDTASAAIVLKELDRKRTMLFYHTGSHCCQLGTAVYLFNTLKGDNAVLRSFFGRFSRKKEVIIPYEIPCFSD